VRGLAAQESAPKLTTKQRRRLRKKEPQVVEDPKRILFLKGPRASQQVLDVVRDLRQLTKPYNMMYSRANDVRPFEDAASLQFYSTKTECALFGLASHTKKRPHNLVLGRFFDHEVLDMYELGVEQYTALQEFKVKAMPGVGSKPVMVFKGEKFEFDPVYRALRFFLLDFFKCEVRDYANLAQVDRAVVISTGEQDDKRVYFRHYAIQLKRSGTRLPRVELAEIGPRIDLSVRRSQPPQLDDLKRALQHPVETTGRKKKNISTNVFGQRVGTIHMNRQDFSKMQVKKSRALTAPAPEPPTPDASAPAQ